MTEGSCLQYFFNLSVIVVFLIVQIKFEKFVKGLSKNQVAIANKTGGHIEVKTEIYSRHERLLLRFIR